MFLKKPSFFKLFVCNQRGFEFAPARGSPVHVSDYVMTSPDYIEVEQIRTRLLSFSLANFQQFLSECFFRFCFSLFLPAYMVHVQFLPMGSCVSFVLFSLPGLEYLIFFGLKSSNCFPVKTVVFGRSFIFCNV